MNLKNIFAKIIKRLDEIDQDRENILKIARQIVRECSVAIKSIHRQEFNIYDEKINEIKENHDKLLKIIEKNPESFGGYKKTPEQEYMEALCLYSIINEQELPDPKKYNVSDVNFLLGLADVIGELRRHVLDKIRSGDVDKLNDILKKMEDIYTHLFSLDYPKGIIQELRRKTDVARGLIEKTRGEISLTMQMHQLKQHLKHEEEIKKK
ncbi:MAG: hypothetical protein ACFFBP_01715 [Promethearchaeota archaeon]